jgi:sigma-B regulation protein RsbU (phosphoserine phosphatase)
MEAKVLDHIRGRLLEKRQTVTDWLRTTPARTREVRLGSANERSVRTHLKVIDTALEKTATKTLGRCTVCHEFIDAELLEMDYTACVCIDHFSPAEIRRLEYELELSQTVQRALLPQEMPEIPGLELAAFSRPAEIVSGDYFDFFRFQGGGHGLAIADVAGKGVSASLLMASVQTALRGLAPADGSPVDVLERLNRLFLHNIQFTTFVTVFLGSFDPTTRTLTYGNAGHNPPLLFRREEKGRDAIAWLSPTGAAIGLVEAAQFTEETVELGLGDILLLYTDGVTEALNLQEEVFGPERLAAFADRESNASAQELVPALRRELQKFTRGQPLADDTTIIACKVVE